MIRRDVAYALLVAGCCAQVIAVLGLVVMRDALDRLHYVGLASLGVLLVGIAILVRESFSLIGDKALATGAVLVLFGPVLVHTTARTLRARAHGEWDADLDEAEQ